MQGPRRWYEGLPGSLKTGCINSPELKSCYCKDHQVRVCGTKTTENKDDAALALGQPSNEVIERILEQEMLPITK